MIDRSLDWIKVSKLKLPLANTKYRTTAYASGVRMHFVCGLALAFFPINKFGATSTCVKRFLILLQFPMQLKIKPIIFTLPHLLNFAYIQVHVMGKFTRRDQLLQ